MRPLTWFALGISNGYGCGVALGEWTGGIRADALALVLALVALVVVVRDIRRREQPITRTVFIDGRQIAAVTANYALRKRREDSDPDGSGPFGF